ncbi:MAG: hypothetical protein O2985_12365 [Proteobacteria bacterium]|nr:hypothetical protein [Pseudomonadota bacterium]
MAFDMATAGAHVRDAVLAAPLSTEPFAHLLIQDFYPDAIYDEIMERWPALSLFRHTNAMTRYEFGFRKVDERLSAEERAFWTAVTRLNDVANLVIQQRLAPHFGEKFEPYVGAGWRQKLDGNVDCLPTSIQLASYTQKFGLPPHVDSLRLLTNAFVYFSERPASEPEPELGTVLYKSRGLAIPTNWPFERKVIEPFLDRVAVSPYQRNHCLAYINSPRSFHGVDELDIGDRHRRLLMFGSLIYVREVSRIMGQEMGDWIMNETRPK